MFVSVISYGQTFWSWKDTITQGNFGVFPATSTFDSSGRTVIKTGKFTNILYLGADDTIGSGLSKITLEAGTGNISSSGTVTVGSVSPVVLRNQGNCIDFINAQLGNKATNYFVYGNSNSYWRADTGFYFQGDTIHDAPQGSEINFASQLTFTPYNKNGLLVTAGNRTTSDWFNIAVSSTLASSSSPGTAGDIRRDNYYVYICTATNAWARIAIPSTGW
jgi:hypothetical protein